MKITSDISENTEFEAARKALAIEEQKMEAGKPNNYAQAMRRFCDAQRAAEMQKTPLI
jgi:hypothetical protein